MSTQLVELINLVFTALMFAIIGRALISWVDPRLQSPVGQLLVRVTEPIISPIRQVVPTLGMFDISPIIALLLLQVVQRMVNTLLLT